MPKQPKSIAITGASSGLGRALAVAYAQPGVTLFISGRHSARLEQTATECRQLGARAVTSIVDVCDSARTRAWIEASYATQPIDILFANAGISGGTAGGLEPEAQVRAIFQTNLEGVLNTIHPTIEAMLAANKPGQIAILSSIAGVLALPSCPAYSASKAAVHYYGLALAPLLRKKQIHLTTILPGYIVSGMTATNDFPMPGIISSKQAANLIRKRLTKKPYYIVFPWWFYAILRALGWLPVTLRPWILTCLPGTNFL